MRRLLSPPLLLLASFALLVGCAPGGGRLSGPEERSLAGRPYVLVGASSGFGQGVALDLGRRGANVVLAARRADLLEDVASRVRAEGAAVLVVPMDISQAQDVKRLAASATERFGRVDVWINFAGIGAIGRFWVI